ncbi:MAG: acyl-CoA dehydrogenase [Candidatus Abyssobacteria bacterium SURF_5]|uniref:Acyl-CoA dehydrogenase n=1 Tax=Abyssobacteria bacterium (strain SURF_5) TaxID=2093360 RepID=A0A3A4NRJ1_ABYX5|nr:MAG: acyl-CoA dehydrogenase [Candidatus Abyssubacteria bacterium SURF_5]
MGFFLDLNVNLTNEQIALREEVHRFAAEVMRPAADKLDKMASPADVIAKNSILWDVIRQSRELGYHTRGLPEELGGLGLTPAEGNIIGEELGWGSPGLSVCMGAGSMPFMFAAMFGGPQMIEEFVIPFRDDKKGEYIGCWAITEPEHGGGDQLYIGSKRPDIPLIRHNTRAKLDGDHWVINGQKSAWVSNGTIATHAMLHASIDGTEDQRDAAIFFVPLNLKGVTKGKPLDKVGQRDLNQGEVYFDDVHIPRHYMLVGPEMLEPVTDIILSGANGGMSTTFTGVARAAFEEALEYTKVRVAGAKIISQHQLIQKKLFDMFTKVESARALARAVNGYNAQTMPPEPHYAMAAKVHNTQIAFEVASDALQILAGNGLSREYPIERIFRDARAALIEDGDNDTLSLGGARFILERYGQSGASGSGSMSAPTIL